MACFLNVHFDSMLIWNISKLIFWNISSLITVLYPLHYGCYFAAAREANLQPVRFYCLLNHQLELWCLQFSVQTVVLMLAYSAQTRSKQTHKEVERKHSNMWAASSVHGTIVGPWPWHRPVGRSTCLRLCLLACCTLWSWRLHCHQLYLSQWLKTPRDKMVSLVDCRYSSSATMCMSPNILFVCRTKHNKKLKICK